MAHEIVMFLLNLTVTAIVLYMGHLGLLEYIGCLSDVLCGVLGIELGLNTIKIKYEIKK